MRFAAIGLLSLVLVARGARAQSAEAGAQTTEAADLSMMDPRAKAHLERGAEQYTAKNYDGAIREFRAGYEIEPRGELLFAWAQAERLRGNCADAVGLYRRVLSGKPTAQQAELAQHHLERCESLLPKPWYTDVLGDVLVGAGAVGVGVGVGMYVASVSDEEAAPSASTLPEYSDDVESARTKRTIALVSGGVGVGLILAGVARYVWGRAPSAPTEVTASAGPRSAAVWLTGRW